jgi:hypothetical protein
MREMTILLFLAVLSCGQTALTDGEGGAAGFAGGAGSGGSGGAAGSGIGSNCIDEAFDAGAQSCSYTLPLPCKPCVNCAPLQPGDNGGCGAPDISIFDWHGGGVDTSLRYPVGCDVLLPTENPFYPGGPQPCICSTMLDSSPIWQCPI